MGSLSCVCVCLYECDYNNGVMKCVCVYVYERRRISHGEIIAMDRKTNRKEKRKKQNK